MADATGVKMNILRIPPEMILKLWPLIEPQIEKAFKYSQGENNTFDIFKLLMEPEVSQCWIVFDENKNPINVTITRINIYGSYKALCIVTTTSVGDSSFDSYKHMHDEFYNFAQEKGLSRIEMYGRKGWKKKLTSIEGPNGESYKEIYTTMSMDVITQE